MMVHVIQLKAMENSVDLASKHKLELVYMGPKISVGRGLVTHNDWLHANTQVCNSRKPRFFIIYYWGSKFVDNYQLIQFLILQGILPLRHWTIIASIVPVKNVMAIAASC